MRHLLRQRLLIFRLKRSSKRERQLLSATEGDVVRWLDDSVTYAVVKKVRSNLRVSLAHKSRKKVNVMVAVSRHFVSRLRELINLDSLELRGPFRASGPDVPYDHDALYSNISAVLQCWVVRST